MKIPPNGFIGTGSQSVAVQQLVSKAMGPKRKTRRKKRVTKKRPVRRRTTTRKKATRRRSTRAKKPAYMVKGSAAAKRHMAKLRRMRKG